MTELIKMLDDIFVKKAPFQLPENAKEWIVKFGPWITVILLVVTAPLVFAAFGISLLFVPLASTVRPDLTMMFWVGWLFIAASFGLEILALPGLFARKKQGWMFLFYGVLLNAVYNLVSFNIVNLILGTVISLYFLFQIRSKYS